MNRTMKIALPLVVLLSAAVGSWALISSRPEAETRAAEAPLPVVRVAVMQPETVRMKVESQGTVSPRTATQLVPEVSGLVIAVDPRLRQGGFFGRGDVLLKIDPREYEWAVTRAEASVAQAELRLAQEQASAAVARREWQELGEGEGTPLALRELQVKEARASLAATRAALEQARLDLERTRVRAPFDGRVLEKSVDIGQFVSRGSPMARIYSIDAAEVRLPVPDDELRFLDLPLGYDSAGRVEGPVVLLSAEFAGGAHTWEGRVVRTDGQIDPRTRMVGVVAEVEDPYEIGPGSDRPPLVAGMFVRAQIVGTELSRAFRIPRVALRESSVLVLDDEDRVRFREVTVARAAGDVVFVTGGIEEGERVCVSPLQAAVDGMRVVPVIDGTLPSGEEGGAA
jgi:RND family efflux transporter MFP subunit